MKYSVFVTRDIPNEGLDMLRADDRLDVRVYPKDEKIPREILLEEVKHCDILLSILTEKIDAEVFAAAGDRLKMIANYAVGFDNIDLEEAKKRGIVVTNAPHEYISESVAEHTVALMLALAHRIVETDAFTRAGKYTSWGPKLLLGTDIGRKTVGIIGTGHIGSLVVEHLYRGFGMRVLYNDVKPNPELEASVKATFVTKEALLQEADFISLHVPLLPSTRHLISRAEFALMKPTAFIVNTSRGPVVDEKALLEALASKKIAGAGLDVYECEPLIDCDPTDTQELRSFQNVILTPHTASASLQTRQAMSRVAAENILAFTQGKTPPNALT